MAFVVQDVLTVCKQGLRLRVSSVCSSRSSMRLVRFGAFIPQPSTLALNPVLN